MIKQSLLVLLLSSAVAAIPPPPAVAQGAEAFVGGLLGGAIGSTIANQPQRQPVVVRERTVVQQRAPVVNTYQREENRRVQTALNHFGFPAGVPDGALGPNSRAAIGQYQAHMGYGPTGYLSDYEKVFLLSSYDRSIVGGSHVASMMASSGQGPRGLLHAFRQEQMGVPVTTVAVPVPVAPPVAAVPVASPPVVEAAAPEPAPDAAPAPVEVAATATAGLPSFLPESTVVSMASYCNRISLGTSARGGFVTLASMTDPIQALGEQFCLARTHAVEQGDSLAGTVQGFSMAEIQAQCQAFAPSMWEYQARLATQSSAEVTMGLQDFVADTGAAPVQLSGNARICLGVGYRTDDAELALASALILVGLGEEAYGEMLGHHLINGFAALKRTDRGLEWLGIATKALDAGAVPLVPVGAMARVALIEQAVATLSGTAPRPMLQEAAAPPTGEGFVLPLSKPQPD